MMNSKKIAHPLEAILKRSYCTPSLRKYGTIEEITQTSAATTISGDNAPAKANHKTGG
jgi:hypothetical protein